MPELCLAPQIGRKSVRAADRENSLGDGFVPPAAEMPGKTRALSRLSPRSSSATRIDFSGIAAEIAAASSPSGWLRRGRGFREFHGCRGRESRACGRCRRSARDSARPAPAPGPASAGRSKRRRGASTIRSMSFRRLPRSGSAAMRAHASTASRPIRIGLDPLRSPSPPSDPASTIFPDCRIRAPRAGRRARSRRRNRSAPSRNWASPRRGCFDAGFLETLGDIFRDRADVPVGPSRGDDHVVGKC